MNNPINKSRFAQYRQPIIAALGLRAATSLWLALIWWMVDPHFPRTAQMIKETYNHLKMHESLLGRMFLDVWLRWDAVHYMNIAWGGYESAGSGDMNFWPLYPYLVRMISPIFFHETVIAGLVVSTISLIVSAVFFWKLVLSMFNHQELAKWTVFLWVLYPTSIFLVAPFTDSLYACLTVITLWAIYQKKWITAGVFGVLAGLTRSQGILLMVPFLLTIGRDRFLFHQRTPVTAYVGLAIAPLGTLAFFIWRWTVGLPNIFASYSVYSQARIVDPFTSVVLAVQRFILTPDLLMLTEFVSLLLFLGIQVWMLTKPVFRKEFPLIAYGLPTILFVLVKHNLIATPLQSSNRYVLNALPAFIGFAYIFLRMPEKFRCLVILFCITGSMVVGVLYALWIFIG